MIILHPYDIMNLPPIQRFKVGDKVNYSIGSDRYVGTIVSISKKRQMFVKLDYPLNIELLEFTLRKSGLYYEKGRMHFEKKPLIKGEYPYIDPNS